MKRIEAPAGMERSPDLQCEKRLGICIGGRRGLSSKVVKLRRIDPLISVRTKMILTHEMQNDYNYVHS